MSFKFQKDHSFEKRVNVSGEMRKKYPESIPIVLEPSSEVKEIDKKIYKKFITPSEIKFNELLGKIREHLKLDPSHGIYVFLNNDTIPAPLRTLGELYNEHKHEDGFLYMSYSFEHTFGGSTIH